MKKIVILTLELCAQVFFALDQYLLKIWVENTVFAIQHIGNRKKFYWSAFPPPVTKLILLHTVVVLHLTHHIKMAWLVTGGNDVKMLKNNFYKNLLGTYFVQTCRWISIYNGMYQGFSYECVPIN